jgi:3'(2'), 5'-bisphosphate nucleotidase
MHARDIIQDPTVQDPIIQDPGLIDELTTLVSRAAAAILAARAGSLATRSKADSSPVTAADEASEAVILEGLARTLPGIPVVSEEAGAPASLAGDTYLLVDPLDGTRELVAGRDEFCVNVGLVSAGRPRLGLIGSPVMGLIWRTTARGAERLRLAPGAAAAAASEQQIIKPRPWPPAGATAAVSRSHLDEHTQAFLARLPPTERLASGSALKLCRVAEGTADVYPRLGQVHQWDVAAGDAILTAAGGMVTTPDGTPLTYDPTRERFLVDGFVAWGDASAPARLGLTKA